MGFHGGEGGEARDADSTSRGTKHQILAVSVFVELTLVECVFAMK